MGALPLGRTQSYQFPNLSHTPCADSCILLILQREIRNRSPKDPTDLTPGRRPCQSKTHQGDKPPIPKEIEPLSRKANGIKYTSMFREMFINEFFNLLIIEK